MKIYGTLIVVLIFLSACALESGIRPGPSARYDTSRVERRILVTFIDRSLGQTAFAEPAYYRPRGRYQSSSWSRRVAAKLATDYHLRQLAQWPIKSLGVACIVYEVSEDQSVEQVLEALAKDRRVESVQKMKLFRVLAYSDPYFRLQAGFQSMQIEAAHRWATGENIRIAVIDTGVDTQHPDLVGQFSVIEDFIEGSQSFTNDIHGTAVAGVIAALADNNQGIVGIAPEAKLITLKACWPEQPYKQEAVCDSLSLAQALNAVVELKPEILNMSLTGSPDPLLSRLLEKVFEQGTIVIAADDSQTDQIPAFPASMDRIIPVRMNSEEGGIQAFTKPTWISAPGSEILTTLPYGTYDFMSGSSFAAAHVSGIVALLLELQPHISSEQILELLRSSVNRQSKRPESANMINVCAAIAKLKGPSVVCPPSSA